MSSFQFHSRKRMSGSNNEQAITMFANKSFGDVWEEFKLTPNDVNPLVDKDGKSRGIQLKVKDILWDIPFSSGIDPDELVDDQYLNDCMFRTGHPYVRKEGIIVNDDKGEPLVDETRSYLNFGKPNGAGWVADDTDFFGRSKKVGEHAGVPVKK